MHTSTFIHTMVFWHLPLDGTKHTVLWVALSQARHRTSREELGQNIKLSTAHSFFELQSLDFSWKFKQISKTDRKKNKMAFKNKKSKNAGFSGFFACYVFTYGGQTVMESDFSPKR